MQIKNKVFKPIFSLIYIAKDILNYTMGLFKRKEKEAEKIISASIPQVPKLPELPRLDGLPKIPQRKTLSKLPSYPLSPLGKKFSQNTIKEAITGKKIGDEGFDENDFAHEDDEQMIQKPSINPLGIDFDEDESEEITTKDEPVFIRIDKFEESLKTFEKTKKQISDIGEVLKDIKKIKEEEEKELQQWEKEILSIKKKIEKIDKDIFSKIQ